MRAEGLLWCALVLQTWLGSALFWLTVYFATHGNLSDAALAFGGLLAAVLGFVMLGAEIYLKEDRNERDQ